MLILMIAAGILLAVVLLPFLGPLVLLALGVGGALLIGYLILMSIGAVMALFGLAKEAPAGARKLVGDIQAARAQSFSGQVAADPSYAQGMSAIGELLIQPDVFRALCARPLRDELMDALSRKDADAVLALLGSVLPESLSLSAEEIIHDLD